MTVHLLWDADYLVYAAGFAVEKMDYLVQVGDTVHGTYTGKEKVNKAVEKLDKAEYRLWKNGPYLEEDGATRAKHNIRSMADGLIDEVAKKLKVAREDITFQMYLTAPPNFRDDIATIKPYKGNRAKSSKPLLYDELREYLCEAWGARIIKGHEADDEICIEAHRFMKVEDLSPRVVIVHVDKDLLMIPGLHYNPNKGWVEIDRMRGLREFYRQILTGDVADNIGGCYKVGEKAAKAAIKPSMTEEEMWQTCVALYQISIDKYGEKCPYFFMEAEAAARENAILLWMQTEEGEIWQPPGDTQCNARSEAEYAPEVQYDE